MDETPFEHWLALLERDGYLDAEMILQELFVHVDTEGRACRCGCHPSLGSLTTHGGNPCPCTLTAEERGSSMRTLFAELHAEREAWEATDEGRAELARRAAEKAELEAWIAADAGVEVTEWGGCFPEQWTGSVDGHSFYFREKRGDWSIEIDLQPTGEAYNQLAGDDGLDLSDELDLSEDADSDRGGEPQDSDADEGAESPIRTRLVEIERGHIIAEGRDSDLGVTPLHHGRFIANAIRAHLRREGCHHPGARRYCPECGLAMT